VERPAEVELVEVVGAGGVARRRDREALGVLLRVRGLGDELREHPAVRELVVDDHRVSVVVRGALTASTGPELVDRRRGA